MTLLKLLLQNSSHSCLEVKSMYTKIITIKNKPKSTIMKLKSSCSGVNFP
jgi:hypothetical protein